MVELEETYSDREIDSAFRKVSAPDFKARCLPACFISREVNKGARIGSMFDWSEPEDDEQSRRV